MAVTGAPLKYKYHALKMSNMALEMRNASYDINNPITNKHIEIRIGDRKVLVISLIISFFVEINFHNYVIVMLLLYIIEIVF